MMNEVYKKRLDDYADFISRRLEEYADIPCTTLKNRSKVLIDAVRYSLLSEGKKLRAALVLEFCRICGGDMEQAAPAACALEMVHAYSLIHDDLPCMDNDDMRRGKPSCHKAFDEATALLAGDALGNLALSVIANDKVLSDETKIKLICELTDSAGISGMIGGQVIDMQNINGAVFTEEELTEMNEMKTGALIKCACRMGCICAGAYSLADSAGEYGRNLGIVFQITDDILDIISTDEELGKHTGSDAELGKNTYAVLLGTDNARKAAESYNIKAKSALNGFSDTDFLTELADHLLLRRK